MLQYLRSCVSFIWIIYQHFHYDVLGICAHVGDQFCYAYKFLSLEIKLHVCGVLLEVVQKLLRRRAHYIVDLIYLVKFVITRKQREKRENLKKDATSSPNVHFVPIIAVS